MKIYILLTKNRQHQMALPGYEIHSDIPEVTGRNKLVALEPDECIDVASFTLSPDLSYIQVMEYRVSNINGLAKEELTEAYTLPRPRA